MKKILLSIFAICLGLMVNAQQTNQTHEISESKSTENKRVVTPDDMKYHVPFQTMAAQGPVVWSEDFSNGIPANWSNIGYTDSSGVFVADDSCKWEYRGPMTTPNNTVGTRGAWSGPVPINSPSANNGFIIFDSDYYDNRGSQTGAGTGQAPTPHIGTLITDTIDLSAAQPLCMIEANFYARRFLATVFVAISQDGGATYPDTLEFPRPALNGITATNLVYRAFLPVGTGGNPNVRLQFIYDGVTETNVNGSGYYFAQLDDIIIREADNFDTRLDAIDILSENLNDRYGIIPKRQIDPLGYTFDGTYTNIGNATSTNTQLKVDITDASSTNVYSNTSSGKSVNSLVQITDTVGTPFNPNSSMLETYTMNWSVIADSTDQNPTNNSRGNVKVQITDELYAKDNNSGARTTISTESFTNDGSQDFMMFANRFEILATDTLEAVEVILASGTRPGALMKVYVYDTSTVVNALGPNNWPNPSSPGLYESDFYTLKNTDIIFRKATIPMKSSQTATLGFGAYYVCVEILSNLGVNPVVIPSDEQVTQATLASMIMLPGGTDVNANPRQWYTNGNSHMIRMKMARPIPMNINDLEKYNFSVSQNFPNPFDKVSNFTINLEKNADVQISVTNVLGQEMFTESHRNLGATNHTFELDASKWQAGVYFYTVTVDNQSITKKMTVK